MSGAWEKQAAGGPARLDYTQNGINKTLVAPYSVRREHGRARLDADHVGRARRSRICAAIAGRSATRLDRLAEVGDLMAPMLNDGQPTDARVSATHAAVCRPPFSLRAQLSVTRHNLCRPQQKARQP